ncbi:MAG: hypothetical protein E6K53_07620 [Gammaproteobacteria bacterium]|nr:MAG: hypothetical protein E6K53_07620 [Gammaproteobacteria bacterium]
MIKFISWLLLPLTAIAAQPTEFHFDGDVVGRAPLGFEFARTGQGPPGRWLIRAESDAPSAPNVLAQTDADETDYRFPIALTGPAWKNGRVSVKCKSVAGKVDQGCGLVLRALDADNYYVVRANALEDNVRLYHVVKGRRVQFAGWNGKVASGVWHELAIDANGDHFSVSFDGRKVIDARDQTFSGAGKFGVWTKADSIIYFDDLVAQPR